MEDSNSSGPDNLLESEAKQRSILVSSVEYKLNLRLKKSSPTYSGSIEINFHYKGQQNLEKPLFLDFKGKQILSFKVNGEKKEPHFHGNRIAIGSLFQAGAVSLLIDYINDYDHGGDGFHQFTDPEDGQEYLYTQFEPFCCHRWIPCFDQPDIKATLKLSVEAPSDWKVIANSREEKVENKGEVTFHSFLPTPRISTYLYAIVVGPYEKFEDVYDQRVPLGIFARKSLAKYLDYQVVFEQLKQGLKFYEGFFDFKYPFDKYDQIFVPEFNMGAMENVGCVTFTEQYVFKTPPTRSQIANRADTILHECAHMWFGNLVTPVWWDGLWLNESFATYMAGLCVCEATEFGNLSWQNFNSSMKQWAYREDQLSTTHAIQGTVVDTETTFLIFDGITYGKGASLLKQLVFLVGMDNFKAGMRNYFKIHAWGNTNISQFLQSIADFTKNLDAKSWSREWLETPGLNTLQLHYEAENGAIKSAFIEQSAPESHPTLRNHAAQIVTYELENGLLKKTNIIRANVKAQRTTDVPELVGKKVPEFIFINDDDYAFAKCPLDPKSFGFVMSNMELISDPLLRQLLWTGFYDLVRDAKMKSTDFLELVSNKIGIETDPKLVQTILNRASSALIHFVPKSLISSFGEKLFDSIYALLQKASISDFKIIWARYSVEFARSLRAVTILFEQVKNENPLFTQELRWGILVKAIAWELPGASAALDAEKGRDKSDIADRAILKAGTSIPKIEVKNEAWERFVTQNTKLSVHQAAAEMSGFHWAHQEDLLVPFIDKFFISLRSVFKSKDKEYSNSFFYSLFPSDPENPSVLEKANALLAQLEEDEKQLTKLLKEEIDDLNRELKCRKLVQGQ